MDVAAEVAGVKFVFGARNDSREDDETTMPDMPKLDNYVNVGQLRREEFVKQLARSRVLVGVGNPLMYVSSPVFRSPVQTFNAGHLVHECDTRGFY